VGRGKGSRSSSVAGEAVSGSADGPGSSKSEAEPAAERARVPAAELREEKELTGVWEEGGGMLPHASS